MTLATVIQEVMTEAIRISDYLNSAYLLDQIDILESQHQNGQEVRERLGRRSPSGKNITLA